MNVPLVYPRREVKAYGTQAAVEGDYQPGETVVVCQNGVFGGRMKENVERCGGTAVVIQDAWGAAVDPAKVEAVLDAHPEARIVAFVHAETSTGAQSDAKRIAEIAHARDALVIADTVTSLGGTPVEVDAWGLDAVYSGTQKCLSCAPGLSPVTFGERAVHKIRHRRTRVQSWFLDLNLIMGYWGGGQKRAYHHTAPVNALYGLHEALLILEEEGIENAWERHRRNHLALRAGLEAMGLRFVVAEADRLPQLNAIAIPEGVDDAAVRRRLLDEFNLEIGAGLGDLAGKVWRIGLMERSSRAENVVLCLAALEAVLGEASQVRTGAAIGAAQRVLAS
jgi:alanine-glyoxylate transaminase/serine-glyoxylate transaminase/serine-pyruvate transaminase